ncbi:hypothetical protein LCGC14_1300860 [marine sediment metagenome]|uniref:Uncharacterized protein n=1 Tax=marine sediment metagenome TaxID=412755 RepID=A0A0F9N6B4_9ZZZZ
METKPAQKEICRMTLTFPVNSDEHAINIKKKISRVLSELQDAQINFSLMNLPNNAPNGE